MKYILFLFLSINSNADILGSNQDIKCHYYNDSDSSYSKKYYERRMKLQAEIEAIYKENDNIKSKLVARAESSTDEQLKKEINFQIESLELRYQAKIERLESNFQNEINSMDEKLMKPMMIGSGEEGCKSCSPKCVSKIKCTGSLNIEDAFVSCEAKNFGGNFYCPGAYDCMQSKTASIEYGKVNDLNPKFDSGFRSNSSSSVIK